jgi:hypothetical protein
LDRQRYSNCCPPFQNVYHLLEQPIAIAVTIILQPAPERIRNYQLLVKNFTADRQDKLRAIDEGRDMFSHHCRQQVQIIATAGITGNQMQVD